MTFRITRLDDAQGTVLRIDGWLEAEGLHAVVRELERAPLGPSLTLDLAGLRHTDAASVALLRTLAARGARFVGCPPYLALRLAVPAGPDGHDVQASVNRWAAVLPS